MNIGKASRASGLSEKSIRKYQQFGLLPDVKRQANDYRDFSASDVRRLQFIRGARALGFSLAQVKCLLVLHDDSNRSCRDVRAFVMNHARDLDRKASEMRRVADTILRLAQACDGSDAKDCIILDSLANGLDIDPHVSASPRQSCLAAG